MFDRIGMTYKRWRVREDELFERWASWLPGSNPGALFGVVCVTLIFIPYCLCVHYLDSRIIREYISPLYPASIWISFIVGMSITARWRSRVPVSAPQGIQPFLEKCARQAVSLEEIALPGAVLIHAQLQGAFLSGANLESANLAFANLEGANLDGACLEKATLTKTNFSGVSLVETDLTNTDLSQVLGLTLDQLTSARGNASTQLPAGLARPVHWPSF